MLPFENLSPDPANAFFADGMHEELLSALGSRARKLEVISRTTMMTYRGKPTDVRALARDLGATHVLEGSVRREASTVRVTLQLVDAVADRQIWSRSYQATLVDAMTLQAQLAREVAEQLAIQLPTARSGQLPPPRSPEAYDEWLKGTLAWQQVGGGGATASEIDRVEAMFTRAIELDDTYGAAYADRARVRIARFVSHADGSEANLAGARADIALAQKYAGGTPHVLVRAAGLAFLVDRDLPRALGLIEAAEQVGPLDAGLLLTKGNFLMFAGRLEESLAVQAAGGPARPGQRRHLSILGLEPRRGAPSRRDDARAGGLRLAVPGPALPGRVPVRSSPGRPAAGGTKSRGFAAAAIRTRRCRPSSTCCATRGGYAGPARAAGRGRLPPSSRSTAPFGARVGASLKPVGGATRLGAAARRRCHGRRARRRACSRPSSSGCRMPAWNEWWRRLLRAESAVMLGDDARALEHARAALRLVGDTATFPESVHVRLMAARVLAWARRARRRRWRCSRRSRAATRASVPRPSCATPSSARRSRRTRAGDRWSRR